MSKFIDQIKYQLLGKSIDPWSTMLKCNVTKDDDKLYQAEINRYRVDIRYGTIIECEQNKIKDALNNVIMQLRHEIYGELEKRVYELQRAVIERDGEKAESICRDIIIEIKGN